ncbi:serine--tRNA synthetase-like protein Slimp [Photinus pyralis]|uniref:Aminoacyl-tRNA synthetase class II (G/ P/ S/T) domain-containing protein n=1 Tax=Photinus pyralis TaxID=7054 RepID=A0A1Y1NJS3_PHOPY|nr:serine--tRNA synthetase-like protein Slimp [Photinus pyralis]
MTRYLQIVTRRLSSALYVTADKAQDHFVLLTPYINFDEQLENKPKLERSIKLRGINVDLERIERRWLFFRYLDEQRLTLELTKGEIGKEIADLLKRGDNVENLKLQAKLIKDDLKMLKNYLYGVEESAALAVLSLPNSLHPNTPDDTERLLFEYLPTSQRSSRSHMEIGGSLIKFINPYLYYLRGDAALFEYLLTSYMSSTLASFTRISNSDFCRSVIVEGCATDFRDKSVFTLEKCTGDVEFTRTHLVGGASLYAFMTYFTKHLVTEKRLPLRLFTTARSYNPNTVRDDGLFSVNQETSLEFFLALKDDEQEMEEEFNKVVSLLITSYKALGYHFRLVYIPAQKLKNHECLRVSIEMFSSFTQTYKEVGHCSIIDSFLSKRLLFTYDINKERKFVRIISGTLLKVPPLLACVLENNGRTDNLLTDFLRKYV